MTYLYYKLEVLLNLKEVDFLTNFIFSLEAVLNSFWRHILNLTQYQLLWGFVLGFAVATLLYGFLITGENKKAKSNGHSTRKDSKVKLFLLLDAVLFLLLVLLLMLKF
ncbi:MAG: hypothetical protein PHU71_01275 [Candidatus Gracilibacteria bacterium]|nr:hypothetical protein [Candidatus Gracilibacteria bacterium]